ncbi:MAG: hypothetical protein H0X00_20220 [Sporichthya sp.]|nr:hypothetical protein [Sporichthya sp.]MBA3745217.1 hypothetical protein [Sporichthya sp.]
MRAAESTTEGLGWKRVAATVEVAGSLTKADLEACWELGATVAATLTAEAVPCLGRVSTDGS